VTTYIPLNQSESAEQIKSETILPKAIYETLVKLIVEAKDTAQAIDNNKNNLERSHKAISIDGERGSGKTSILVNLKSYIESTKQELLSDIHILEPIDPTLLEDGESLFLHVIVAAILHDEDIKRAQACQLNESRSFSHALEKLASALESVDDQKDLRGMDKIRSLYGNKHLVNCVTDFFKSTLKLLNKKLLVLPIDDVDTSLNLAFENLEIIRRYLVAPCVLPIVSGDRKLYDEVCWRDFHGRLIKDSNYLDSQAYDIAQDLANEYQRKILPLPRRLSMPSVDNYWTKSNIKLGNEHGMSLKSFISWLEIFLAGPVNGLENSELSLPIPSVRALTQFIAHCGSLISKLPEEIKAAEESITVQRLWQMPCVTKSAIEAFHNEYQKIYQRSSRDYKSAYKVFDEKIKENNGLDKNLSGEGALDLTSDWVDRLINYFQHEPSACSINLTLQAKRHWLNNSDVISSNTSLFSTPLFQPLYHSNQFKLSELHYDLAEWKSHLEGRLPINWLDEIKNQKTALPYPLPEVGINSALHWHYWSLINDNNGANEEQKNKAIFFISALCHRNYYTNSKRSMMLNIGRIFEIIITSLVGGIESSSFDHIRQRAPFYSASYIAPTKTLELKEENKVLFSVEDSSKETVSDIPTEVNKQIDLSWEQLQEEVIKWREEYGIDKLNISPWLVYKVFNKVFSQVATNEHHSNGMQNIDSALDIAGRVFYGTWSAFGSFEKGELFGLAPIVANTNINKSKNFESNEHFSQNILPFSDRLSTSDEEPEVRKEFGLLSRTVTHALSGHPLRKWLHDVFQVTWTSEEVVKNIPNKVSRVALHKAIICKRLNLNPDKMLTKHAIVNSMKEQNWSAQAYRNYLKNLQNQFSDRELNAFIEAGKELFSEQSDT